MDLDLELVASFLMLVRERHYRVAAASLHLTSSALSKRIRRLEQQLGVSLLERGATGVVAVTPAGQRFAAAAVPLLSQAEFALRAAREEPSGQSLRFGIPAGTGPFLRQLDMGGVLRNLRLDYPNVALEVLNVPYPALTRCLVERRIEVLWTVAPVQHSEIDSVPIDVYCERVGLVDAHHPFAEMPAIDARDFSDEVMRFSPRVPDEWMRIFWLGDVRPRHEARLIEIDATDHSGVLNCAGDGTAVTTGLELSIPHLSPRVRAVKLTGIPPVYFYLAFRKSDYRGAVRALVDAFQARPPLHLLAK